MGEIIGEILCLVAEFKYFCRRFLNSNKLKFIKVSQKSHKNNAPANEFDETLAASKNFFDKYKKPILCGGGSALAVIIIALLVHQFYIVPRNTSAQEALFQAEALYQAGEYEKALNGGDGVQGFLTVADSYGSTKAGNLAQMYAGVCYANLGKYEEAVKCLEKYDNCGDAMVSPAAIGALGNCYAALGQEDKAAATLEKAAAKANNATLSPTFLIQAGQLYQKLGQNDKAKACYEKVKNDYKQSFRASDIDKYIEAIK